MTGTGDTPINAAHLLEVLDKMLLELLQSLSPEEWQRPTIAKLWTVKDVAAHLLDSNLRLLSISRDGYWGEPADVNSYQELVIFLNRLNADWVQAMKRVSPQLLVKLHEITGPLYCAHNLSLDPMAKAIFAVDWAGETESKNWMNIARDYTEKWLHQQQIRDAVNKPGLMTKELFYPFIDIFMRALPHTYRSVTAAEGTTVQLTISSDIGGSWFLTYRSGKWQLDKQPGNEPATKVILSPDIAWKLFSKSLRPQQVQDNVTVTGNRQLGETALSMVAVMA